jgi:hypothetical protein
VLVDYRMDMGWGHLEPNGTNHVMDWRIMAARGLAGA